ncbi:MAG: tripartite tricarboxylate transporter substrate-binding protein [Acetobacteraceae bacterium]|nr:tripartite tricarboxylate transporter substrate-binding protein [Acetobacteraceae bacterium]
MIRRRPLLLAAPALLALPGAARAQGWPARPVRVIVPFPPGSTPDIAGRAVASHFASVFGQPFVVENRSGGGGTTGTDAIAKATDDHTIGVSINAPIATADRLYPRLPYNPQRDIALISLLVRAPQLLVAAPQLGVASPAEFIARARAEPGRLSYASTGTGSASHLAMEALKARENLDITHVAYRGFPEASVDLIAGRVQAMFAIVAAVLGPVREGRMRALGVTAAARFPRAPEIPTLAEQGVGGLESYAWIGLVSPAGLPAAIRARLEREAIAALGVAETRARLENAGFEVMGTTAAEFQAFVEAERRDWGGLIDRLGIRLEL